MLHVFKVKTLSMAFLAIILLGCSNGLDSDPTSEKNTDGEYVGDASQKASKEGLSFASNMVVGSEVTVHGQYDADTFGELTLGDASKVMLVDDNTSSSNYYGAGLRSTGFADKLIVDHDNILEMQSLDYLEFIQNALADRGFESAAIDHYKINNSQASVIKTVVNVSAKDAVNPSFIRNIILIAFNNGVVPAGLPISKQGAVNQVRLEVAYWQDNEQGDVYLWVSSFADKDTDPVIIKYGDVINATALRSFRLAV